jgi:hypothetical protein
MIRPDFASDNMCSFDTTESDVDGLVAALRG